MIQWHTGAKRVETLAFSPDGRTLASATYRGRVVKLWRPDGTPAGRVPAGCRVGCLAFGPGGLLAVGAEDTTVRLHAADGAAVGWLNAEAEAAALVFTPDGSALAALVADKVLWWDAPGRGGLAALTADRRHPAGPNFFGRATLAVAPDGRRLVLNDEAATYVQCVSSGEVLRVRPHPATTIQTHAAVSPDGRRVAASHGRDISVWPLDGDSPTHLLLGSKKSRSVRGMALAPSGRRGTSG